MPFENYPIMFAGVFQSLNIFHRCQFPINLLPLIFITN